MIRSDRWPATDILMVCAIVLLLCLLGYKALNVYDVPPPSTVDSHATLLSDAETALDASRPCEGFVDAPMVRTDLIFGSSVNDPQAVELFYECGDPATHAFIWSVQPHH